ncbi:MAG: isochorismate synthase [Oscillatoriales cyanobacterium SM2_1_8]|nr:isochorismate synthase [Oscillatoriales cyanobacterium SM2_1_8]
MKFVVSVPQTSLPLGDRQTAPVWGYGETVRGQLDPWAIGEALAPGWRFGWAGRDGIVRLALGAVLTVTAAGPDRFATVGAFAEKVWQQTAGWSPPLFGGFAFAPESTDPFPAAVWFVPRWLVQGQGEAWAIAAYGTHEPTVREDLQRLKQALSSRGEPSSPNRLHWAETDDRPWERAVASALQEIGQGKLQKIVLARALDVVAERAIDIGQVWGRLGARYPQCTRFAVRLGGETTFMGASPERLLALHPAEMGWEWHSDAVAGSRPRGQTPAEDREWGDRLLHSVKDRWEHDLVVQSIVGRLGVPVSDAPTPQLLKLHNVQHLYTPIRAIAPKLSPGETLQLLAQLHPTAAVGGEPRDLALQRLRQWEGIDRGWYGGPLGWLQANGEGCFVVGIRSGYVQGKQARLFAGAGIVAGSEAPTERAETAVKFAPLLEAIEGR